MTDVVQNCFGFSSRIKMEYGELEHSKETIMFVMNEVLELERVENNDKNWGYGYKCE